MATERHRGATAAKAKERIRQGRMWYQRHLRRLRLVASSEPVRVDLGSLHYNWAEAAAMEKRLNELLLREFGDDQPHEVAVTLDTLPL